MRAHLKLFVSDDEQNLKSNQPTAAMSLEDFARVISDAVSWDRTWLEDFAGEQIVISRDLYEIVRLYDEINQARA